ncbi:MAG TPA: PilC/PilY family type IV pilus protein [Lysobacter sp.]
MAIACPSYRNFARRAKSARADRADCGKRSTRWLATLLGLVIAGSVSSASAQVEIAQVPLHVGTRVPGNLALVPSVEFPTIISQANLGAYDVSRRYAGYFDADKCYGYHFSSVEAERHFYPVRVTVNHTCRSSSKEWSGNFMNWAATQTIDPFRFVLTGGYRVRDTPTETLLEKARHDRSWGFADRRVPAVGQGLGTVSAAPPASWNAILTQISGHGNRMRFTGTGTWGQPVAYDPSRHTLALDRRRRAVPAFAFEVSVRVKVCVAGLLEANCRPYSQGWKPEGLIQEYSDRMRYSIFGYLNDSSVLRDGGVLRANQKFVGPLSNDPISGPQGNPAGEWNPVTGVLHANPEPVAASATPGGIRDSGVINYLNKFGQLTSRPHKSIDPVSELYYTAVRYFKNQGNVAAYSSVSSGDAYNQADGFPIVTAWNDPIQYRCQANVILGIGDVNTHRDKNLPGNANFSEEPPRPREVSADTTVNVVTSTRKLAELEDVRIGTPFSGRNNSAYIAGLAYDSHTVDIRADLKGMQSVATHWVDVREGGTLERRDRNQYWLAAKYGGFRVPEDYRPYDRTVALPEAWWHSSGDVLASGDKRPDNFYVASDADKMVESLTRAFRSIAAESSGSAASLTSDSTRLDAAAMVFQARFYSPSWRGELSAYSVDPKVAGTAGDAAWNAGDRLAAMPWQRRRIYFHNPQATGNRRYGLLSWDALGETQRAALGDEATLNYLRGDRSNEGRLRRRAGILGDIVHSAPVYVGQPESRLYPAATFTGAATYAAFGAAQSKRRKVVYVGANDGMLHGFDATSGDETYAFMPAAAISAQLKTLTSPDYEHRYFVDGDVSVADVYSTRDRRWKTVLVGSMGRGGRSVFALDITDPDDIRFLWEKGVADLPSLGHVPGKPIIAQVANGDWRVLLGNGANSAGGVAQLIIIAVESGEARAISTGVPANNALSAVDAWDTNRDGFYETVYGGDMKGNLWRFSGVDGVAVSVGKLFAADHTGGRAQPITAAPLVLPNPETRDVWVFFGTGRYLGHADVADKRVQSWYGVIDRGAAVAGRSALVERRIVAESTTGNGVTLRVTSEKASGDLGGKSGWFLDLVSPVRGREGERMVVANRFERGKLIGTTRIPDARDVCSPGGRGFVMALEPFTGSRPSSTFFDANGDGRFNHLDGVKVDAAPATAPASGVGFESSPNGPIFVGDETQLNLDDGTRKRIGTRSAGSKASRVSWRELLLD